MRARASDIVCEWYRYLEIASSADKQILEMQRSVGRDPDWTLLVLLDTA